MRSLHESYWCRFWTKDVSSIFTWYLCSFGWWCGHFLFFTPDPEVRPPCIFLTLYFCSLAGCFFQNITVAYGRGVSIVRTNASSGILRCIQLALMTGQWHAQKPKRCTACVVSQLGRQISANHTCSKLIILSCHYKMPLATITLQEKHLGPSLVVSTCTCGNLTTNSGSDIPEFATA